MPVVKVHAYAENQALDIDLFPAETPDQKELLARRRQAQANGFQAWFVSPEDLILLKLVASRPRDLSDVADILFIQGKLDEGYLRRWAKELNVETRLEAALAEYGET